MISSSTQEIFTDQIKENLFEDYKNNFFPIEDETYDSSLKNKGKISETENLEQNNSQLVLISIIYNLIYLTSQIIIFQVEKIKLPETYLTLGLLVYFIMISLILLILKLKGLLKIDFNLLTCFSYINVFIHVFIITFLSYGLGNFTENNTVYVYVCDFNLILSCFLMILSCQPIFLQKYKKIIISYAVSIIGLIILREIVSKSAPLLINSIGLAVLLFFFSLYFKRKIPMNNRRVETQNEAQITFNHFKSITNALNVGIFICSKEELLFANKTGRRILDNASRIPFNQISHDVQNFNEIKPNTENAEIKLSMSDSKVNLNQSNFKMFPYYPIKEENNLRLQKEINLFFKNIFLNEDNFKICDRISKLKTNNENKENMIDYNVIQNNTDNKEKVVNLYSIFSILIDSDNDCILELKDYYMLGIFEFMLSKDRKTYFKILAKFQYPTSTTALKGRMIEFIFEDVTQYYDLVNKIEETQLNFKKNAHEFKTPILSLLGCSEELKAKLNLLEDVLPQHERPIINNYLDHMTNLSSYIGYLIKGLSKSNKEMNSDSNSVAEYKQIKLNSLLNFCFSILKTLISCDSQKLRQIQPVLKNLMLELDISFASNEIQVKQILLNFLSNSVKFTNHGVIALKAKLKETNLANVLKVVVKDTGCGVKKEDSKKLFGEYSKLNNTENNSFGTGLGLNICKSIADSLNMKIKFTSEENKGSKVILYIFNPIINCPEKVIEPEITWKMSESIKKNDLGDSQVGKLNHIRKINQSVIEEREINFKDEIIRRIPIRSVSTINPNSLGLSTCRIREQLEPGSINKIISQYSFKNDANSESHNSPKSSNSNTSSVTFDIDANNMKSTRRLDINHVYDICRIKKSDKKLNEYVINIQPNSSSMRDIRGSTFKNELAYQKTRDVSSHQSSCVEFRPKEIKKHHSDVTLIKPNKTFSPIIGNTFLPEKILIVDDQLHARRAVVNLVNKYSKEKSLFFDILEECDGIDCLKTIIRFPFNIKYVFIDENMGYMNGTETAQIIRKLSESGKISRINLILISAEDDMNSKGLFDAIVGKPLSKENIEEILDNNK